MKVVYCEELALGRGEFISLRKPREFYDAVAGDESVEFVRPEPVTRDDLIRAHDAEFVDAVLSGRDPNGFGDTRKDILRQVMYANGAMVKAAELALDHGVACAPVSGFHHAGYAHNGLYCTFNGLMVSLQRLFAKGLIRNALILDLDGHYGDGTQDILDTLDLNGCVRHVTHGGGLLRHAQSTISRLSEEITSKKWDIVLYQAGADSYAGDPYGAGYFTYQQWQLRDFTVFHRCKESGIPVAWNLAGGYGPKTTKLHLSTYNTASMVYDIGAPD